MASKSRVIYVGVTGFLMARVLRHKSGEGGAFTCRYRVQRLVYFHSFQNVGDAIARETEIKGLAAGEESGFDSGRQYDLGGFGCGLGWAGSE
jgi:putative endonuclease